MQQAYPNENGIMVIDGKLCVALGSIYGEVGNVYRITFEDGQTIEVIKADEKSDKDTTNGVHDTDGSIIEFIVDTNQLDQEVATSGNVGTIYKGRIKHIRRKL